MTTQTAEMTTTETFQTLLHNISTLPECSLRKLAEQAELLAIEAEIAALEEKYGTTPNAKTIAAMQEAAAGGGDVVTIDEIMAELNADNQTT